jgi:RND family efflux transporter MFP subunit
MKLKYCIAVALAAFCAGMALTYGYVRGREADTRPPPVTPAPAAAPALIATARPQMRSFTRQVPWIGDVETRSRVDLTAPVPGRVASIAAGDQDRIQKDRVVMRLGGARLAAERAKDRIEIQSLESQLRLARQTVARRRRSLKAQLATRDQVAQARETQVRLETRLHKARLNLKTLNSQMCIRAPMDGVFTNRRVSPGQAVDAGQVIGEIVDPGRLRIVASIFPPPGFTLQGRQAAINLEPAQVLAGSVSRVLPQASTSGAVNIWIQGPQIDRQLRPGQTVDGTLAGKAVSPALAVPQSAIVYDANEHPYLFVRKDGAYAALSIRLGLMQDGWVQVLAGLEQDQLVVVQGAYELYYRHFNDQFKVED